MGEKSKGIKKWKLIMNCALLILCGIIAGAVLVTAANYLPINSANGDASLEQIGGEGLFPSVPSLQGGYGDFHSMDPTALELATDSLMLKMALYQGEGEGIEQAFRCYSTQYQEEYSRYWHGYVVILRVLLLFFDYYEIRILNYFGQLLVFGLLAFYLWKNKGVKYALALTTSYILLMPMALSQCLQYTWCFYVAFVALLIYMYHRNYWEEGHRCLYLFVGVGVVVNFLDLLTYPLLTWGLLISWWLLLCEKQENWLGYLKKVVFSGFAWIAGYGGMWLGKWATGSLVLRENLFKKAISEALLWTVNEGEDAITLGDRLEALFLNWSIYDYRFYLMILLAWMVYWIGCSRVRTKSAKAPAMFLVACSSPVWYLVLAGHSIMHHIFAHRTFGVSIAAFLGMILLSTGTGEKLMKHRRYILRRLALVGALGVVSVFLTSMLRDDFFRHNGDRAPFDNVITDGRVETDFTPAYEDVKYIHLGFYIMNGTEGYCRVELLDRGNVVEELVLPFAEYTEGNLHEIPVNWKLQAGHDYTIVMEPVDNDGEFYTYYTADSTMPLPEFGELTVEGANTYGQLLAGVTYWCGLREFPARLLFTITFMAIGMMGWYSFWGTGFFVHNYFRNNFGKIS